MYELKFDKKAISFLEKLPTTISQRIFKKIQETKENPHYYFIKLINRKEYKLRFRDYRVIADINSSEIKIYIIEIGHRKNIYK